MKYALKDKYPIETPDQLTKAAEFFEKHLTRFTPEDRVEAAISMDKQASDLGVNINSDWIINYTRMDKSAALSPDFERSMGMRKEACIRHKITINAGGSSINADAFIEGMMKKASDTNPLAIAKMLTEFDKEAGIEYLYDKEIVDPIITVFGSLNDPEFDGIKIAGDATQYDLVRISRDHEKLASVQTTFGEKFASSFKNNPIQSIETLGITERELLSTIAKD